VLRKGARRRFIEEGVESGVIGPENATRRASGAIGATLPTPGVIAARRLTAF